MNARQRLLAALAASPEVRPGDGPALVAALLDEEADHLVMVASQPSTSWASQRRVGLLDGADELRDRAGQDRQPGKGGAV